MQDEKKLLKTKGNKPISQVKFGMVILSKVNNNSNEIEEKFDKILKFTQELFPNADFKEIDKRKLKTRYNTNTVIN